MTKHKSKSLAPTPTKGKGGGKGSAASGGSGNGKDEVIDLKDCPLALSDLCSVASPSIPRFNSVMRRSDNDGVGMEDLDALQLEMETMLSAVVLRRNHLTEETSALQNIDKYKGKNKKGPGSPGKRTGGKDGKDAVSSKKMKLSSGKPDESGKLAKIKHESSGQAFDPLENLQVKRPEAELQSPSPPKNVIPSKFWNFVEPYCAPIQQDDVKFLEDLIKTHNDLSEYYRTPPLGQHYSIRWSREDMDSEKDKGKDENWSEKEETTKKPEPKPDASPFGELTHRLVQGLIEENLMTNIDDSLDRDKGEEDSGSRQGFIQSLNVTNGETLEKRVKKELEDQGILDFNDDDTEDGNDEILAELVRCQSELKAVSNHNLSQLKRLVKSAREEMARQEVRNKLSEADKEVCEAYKRIALARSKKKSPTKKEREMAFKALKDREAILKQLESI